MVERQSQTTEQTERTCTRTCGDTVLAANRLEGFTNTVDLFGGEGTIADTSGVGLDDSKHIADVLGRNAKSSADSTNRA